MGGGGGEGRHQEVGQISYHYIGDLVTVIQWGPGWSRCLLSICQHAPGNVGRAVEAEVT